MKFTAALAAAALAASVPAVMGSTDPIVGGEEANANDYPWMVSLGRSGRHFCGGSLVAPDVVLTAAHCIVYSNIEVRVKGVGLRSSGTETIPVTRSIRHPSYGSSSQNNDVAILLLSRPSTITEFMPVDLGGNGDHAGDLSTVIGWGALRSGGSSPTNLQQVSVPVRTNAECRQSYGNSITSQMVCAGLPEGGKDSCQGDSGGPLFVASGSGVLQIGVVSWGRGCALSRYYGVYARTSALSSFLRQYISTTTPPPTATSPPTPPTGPEVCACDGGNGRYERCDRWDQPQNVCLLAYTGGQSNPPPCVAVEGGELRFSRNYNRWYMVGCTTARNVYLEPFADNIDLVAASTSVVTADGTGEPIPSAFSPLAAGIIGAAAGSMFAAGVAVATVKRARSSATIDSNDAFAEFRVANSKA